MLLSLLLLYLFLHDCTCFLDYFVAKRRSRRNPVGKKMCLFSVGFDKDFEAGICLLYQQYYTKKYCGNLLEMEESCSERQENELQAIQAIYMDDFQDLREKVTSLKFQPTLSKFPLACFSKRVLVLILFHMNKSLLLHEN